MAGNPQAWADGQARMEDIAFFRSMGWDDRRIAERLGMSWDTFTQFFRRHPELGPIKDSEAEERKRWTEFQRAINTHQRRRQDV